MFGRNKEVMSLGLNETGKGDGQNKQEGPKKESFVDKVNRIGPQNEQRASSFTSRLNEKVSGFFKRGAEFGKNLAYAAPTLAKENVVAGASALNRGKEAALDAATAGMEKYKEGKQATKEYVGEKAHQAYQSGTERVNQTVEWATQQKEAVAAKYRSVMDNIQQRRETRAAAEKDKEARRAPLREQKSTLLVKLADVEKQLAAI